MKDKLSVKEYEDPLRVASNTYPPLRGPLRVNGYAA